MENEDSTNGIYYMLGNITSHILHALPLYRQLGGTFIVTSNRARLEIKQRYGIDAINIDNRPYRWAMPGRRPKRIHEYIVLDKDMKRTYDFLNQHADVVIFYELFELAKPEWLNKPKKIFLTHGNMLKNYMTMYPKRLEIVKDYDYMAALGPRLKKQFIDSGVDTKKLVDLGIARTDDIIKHQSEVVIDKKLAQRLKIDRSKKIISYFPTFWGASSIYITGMNIVKNIPENYTLVFRPHPQTPRKLLRKYEKIISKKPNVIYAPEGRYFNLEVVDIFNMSSAIIGDMSSVTLEALLANKPLVFAYDTAPDDKTKQSYGAISKIESYCESIKPDDTASSLADKLQISLTHKIDTAIWREAIDYNFFHADGTSVASIVSFIESSNR